MKKTFQIALTVLVTLAMASVAFAAGTIKIGVQAPITGNSANEGQGMAQAVR